MCTRLDDDDLTDGQKFFLKYAHNFMKKFYGIEDDDEFEELRLAILDCIIFHFDLLQDKGNLANTLKKDHPKARETTLETFLKYVR